MDAVEIEKILSKHEFFHVQREAIARELSKFEFLTSEVRGTYVVTTFAGTRRVFKVRSLNKLIDGLPVPKHTVYDIFRMCFDSNTDFPSEPINNILGLIPHNVINKVFGSLVYKDYVYNEIVSVILQDEYFVRANAALRTFKNDYLKNRAVFQSLITESEVLAKKTRAIQEMRMALKRAYADGLSSEELNVLVEEEGCNFVMEN